MITIHSDDYGYKMYSDKKIIRLLRLGKIRSVSVLINLTNKQRLKTLADLVRQKPHIGVGLHLNLVEGKSAEDKKFIPTLVDKRGYFYPLKKLVPKILAKTVDPFHLEREIRRQIRLVKEAGLKVSFIDSHQHLHALSPVAELVEKVSKEEKVPQIRLYGRIQTFTLIAKAKLQLLKALSYLSYYLQYHKSGLPSSWQKNSEESYAFMSWEGNGFDVSKIKDKSLVFVTHPYLPFDTNKSYMWLIF